MSLGNDASDAMPGAIEALAAFLGTPAEDVLRAVPVVKPVDGRDGAALRQAAIGEHARNVRLFPDIVELEFRDQSIASLPTLESMSPYSYEREIESSNVPLLVMASWLDSGTGRGALARFNTFSNAQEVYIGSWNHGGDMDVDPFSAANAPARFGSSDQWERLIKFFDRYVKKGEAAGTAKVLHYSTLGDDRWRETDRWPLAGSSTQTFYLQADGMLATTPAIAGSGADTYLVDTTASAGVLNRWMGAGNDIVYEERSAEDSKLLVYQTQPLTTAARIAGMPVIYLHMPVDRSDAAVFVDLEDVAPDGRVTYLTEGQLRLVDRAVASVNPAYRTGRVPRSFDSGDARPLPPGETVEVAFDLLPTSARIAAGHSLRIAIAGADADTFAPLDDGAPPTFTIERNAQHASRVEVPIVADDR